MIARQRFASARQLGLTGLAGRLLWRCKMLLRIAWFEGLQQRRASAFVRADWQPQTGVSASFLAGPNEIRAMLTQENALAAADRQRILRQADRALHNLIDIRGYGNQTLCLAPQNWYDYPELELARMANRHDFLIPLCQAFALTHDERYAEKVRALFDYWRESFELERLKRHDTPIDAAIRVLNWIWVLNFRLLETGDTGQLKRMLFLQLEYIRAWSSAGGNHLVLEALANYVYGALLATQPGARAWRRWGRRTLAAEILRQVGEDGVHTEQSMFYHQAVATHFLKAYLVAERQREPFAPEYGERLRKMLGFVHDTLKPDLSHPMLGDGEPLDGLDREHWEAKLLLAARFALFKDAVFEPYKAFLNDSSIWFLARTPAQIAIRRDPPSSKVYPQSGVSVLRGRRGYLLMDSGPFGDRHFPHHGHSDALSIELCLEETSLIIDPGGYGYYNDPYRRYFRSTRAHNTLQLDGREQSETFGVLGYGRLARVVLETPTLGGPIEKASACHYGYAPVIHRREIYRPVLREGGLFVILDWLTGTGEHDVEAFFHLAPGVEVDVAAQTLAAGERGFPWRHASSQPLAATRASGREEPPIQGWYAPATRQRVPIAVLVLAGRVRLPFWSATVFAASDTQPLLSMTGERLALETAGGRLQLALDVKQGRSAMTASQPLRNA